VLELGDVLLEGTRLGHTLGRITGADVRSGLDRERGNLYGEKNPRRGKGRSLKANTSLDLSERKKSRVKVTVKEIFNPSTAGHLHLNGKDLVTILWGNTEWV